MLHASCIGQAWPSHLGLDFSPAGAGNTSRCSLQLWLNAVADVSVRPCR